MHETSARRGARGFTLIELMVVLVIMAVMAAAVIPEMKGAFEDALLRSTARKLVSAASLTQSQAVATRREHLLRIDTSEGRYSVVKIDYIDGQGFRPIPVRKTAGAQGGLDPRVAVEIRRVQEETSPNPARNDGGDDARRFGPDMIAFRPDGTADSVEIRLQDRAGVSIVLQVNPMTGRLRVRDAEGAEPAPSQ